MDNVCEPRRITVQSIRERFEIQQRQTPPLSRNEQPEILSEVDSNHSGSSNASESDHSSTGGGFQQHSNRTSIKRSPAFRTGLKPTEAIPENILKKPSLIRTGLKDPNVIIIKNHKKPSLRRKPGVDRTSKPNLSPEPTTNIENDPLIEEALKAPLPSGPAPKKPPRTFVHDAFIQQQNVTKEADSSPQRPVRRNKAVQLQSPAKPARPTSITLGSPFTMSRSKTEPFLLGRKKSVESEELPAVEDLRRSPLDDVEFDFQESRWLNPVQWNSFSPTPAVTKSPLKKQTSPRVSTSLVTIADPALLQARNGARHGGKNVAGRHPEPTRRMSCDFDGGRRRPSSSEFTWQSSTTGLLRFHGRKEPPVSLGHVYDQPTLEGGLHYMCSPIMEVNDIHSWHNDSRVTDDSDCESEQDLRKSQLVEDRKIYVRRVSSNVADLRKASRPLTIANVEPGAGLFETFLEVALFYDRHQNLHTPYIKSSYPKSSAVPSGMEHFCFPDSTHWPPPLQTAGEPYTIILTDSKGDRMYGYCRRVVPEGAQTCIPITYCLLSRHRAAGFYNKMLNVMVSRHGASVSQRLALLDCLHKQPFPNPGRFVEFPSESPTNGNKVNKVQRLLDGRLEDIDLRVLFERLNETVVLHVLGTVLLERKLIFVSQNLSVLSLCIDAVQSMLYPFVWQHTIVPVLPQSMTEIASAPTPFILGLLSKNVEDWKSIYPDQGMLVDLDSGKVLHNVGDESTILPRRSVRKLMSDWEVTVNITQQAETARNALYSESFLRMFVDLCGHYEQHIHCRDSGHKYFERAVFTQNHSNSSVRDFLEWFTETAMFNLFIESRLRHDAVQTLYEHKILEHSMQIVRPNTQLILPNSKILGRKIKTIGDKLREMNMFA